MEPLSLIDHSGEIAAIREQYGPDYHRNGEAVAQAAALWGVEPNPHGVCRPVREESIITAGRCMGKLYFCHTAKDYWLIGAHGCTAISGFSFLPSVWERIGYHSYDDARLAGVLRLLVFFEGEARSTNSCHSDSSRREAREAVRHLEAEKTPQLTLF